MLDRVEDVLVATLEATPKDATRWSRASKPTIGRIWRKFDLKPHLQGSFKLSTDSQFVDKYVPSKQLVVQGRRAPGGWCAP